MVQSAWQELLGAARRHSRLAHEAEDIVQEALLAAIEAGRSDFTDPQNRRWTHGVIRNQARLQARSAVRRKTRDAAYAAPAADDGPAPSERAALFVWVRSLPASLRGVAAIALTGHTRAEIRAALAISDTALRQRLSALRRVAREARLDTPGFAGLAPGLAHGVLRRRLPGTLAARKAAFGTYDPDGNLLIFRTPVLTKPDGAATDMHPLAAGARGSKEQCHDTQTS